MDDQANHWSNVPCAVAGQVCPSLSEIDLYLITGDRRFLAWPAKLPVNGREYRRRVRSRG